MPSMNPGVRPIAAAMRGFLGDPELHGAACSGQAPIWDSDQDAYVTKFAKSVCLDECPVQQQCLAVAMQIEARNRTVAPGIWGGYTEAERYERREGRRRPGPNDPAA